MTLYLSWTLRICQSPSHVRGTDLLASELILCLRCRLDRVSGSGGIFVPPHDG